MAPFVIKSRGRKPILKLPSVNDVGVAGALRDALLPLVASGRPVGIDGGEVERIATACVQVLLAGAASLAASGHGLSLVDASPPMRAAFADLGLDAELERWVRAA